MRSPHHGIGFAPICLGAALQRAADIVGGPEAHARKLRVTPSHLELWLKGLESPREEFFLRAVDIVSDDQVGALKNSD